MKTRFIPSALFGAALGAAAVYLFDPDRGRSRRARLSDQTAALMRKAGREVEAKARYQRGVAKGVMHEMTEPLRPDRTVDDETLVQKIRSEAIGRWRGAKRDVDIEVRNGEVTVRGQASPEEAEELLDLIRSVDGVRTVSDQISLTQGA